MRRTYNCPECGAFLSLDLQQNSDEELQVDAICHACGFRGMAIIVMNSGVVRWPDRINFDKLEVLIM